MLELIEKDINIALLMMFQEVKGNILEMNDKNLLQRNTSYKKNQIEILQLKNGILEIDTSH